MSEFCPNLHMLAVSKQPSGSEIGFVRLRCKMWTCEYCAKINRLQWRAKLIHHIHATQGAWSWFTLTAHSQTRGEERSIANLRRAWEKIIKRLKRK